MFNSRIETITEIKWDGEKQVEIHQGNCIWAGAKRKDFWNPEDDWESKIKVGTRIRLWTIQWSRVIGFEAEIEGEWVSVWCVANDFQTKAEQEAASKAYTDFIIKEGKKIAIAIDYGRTLKQIDNKLDSGHSGNTYACALAYGIEHAKNKQNARTVRDEHNLKHGVKGKSGVVDPAILTVNL